MYCLIFVLGFCGREHGSGASVFILPTSVRIPHSNALGIWRCEASQSVLQERLAGILVYLDFTKVFIFFFFSIAETAQSKRWSRRLSLSLSLIPTYIIFPLTHFIPICFACLITLSLFEWASEPKFVTPRNSPALCRLYFSCSIITIFYTRTASGHYRVFTRTDYHLTCTKLPCRMRWSTLICCYT